MTRKHFIALAEALAAQKPTEPIERDGLDGGYGGGQVRQWENDCHAIADVCGSANGLFDRARFLAACGAPLYV